MNNTFSPKAPFRNSSGFTLIEVLLYTVLAGSMLFSITTFFGTVIEGRIKNQTVAEVEEQGIQILQLMTQTIRNAESINSPASGTSPSLSLEVSDSTKNPTIFDLSGNTLRIREGSGSPLNLTSPRILLSGMSFQNLSRSGSPGTIRIQFTLSHVNQTGRNEYSFSQTFSGSASLRHP